MKEVTIERICRNPSPTSSLQAYQQELVFTNCFSVQANHIALLDAVNISYPSYVPADMLLRPTHTISTHRISTKARTKLLNVLLKHSAQVPAICAYLYDV